MPTGAPREKSSRQKSGDIRVPTKERRLKSADIKAPTKERHIRTQINYQFIYNQSNMPAI